MSEVLSIVLDDDPNTAAARRADAARLTEEYRSGLLKLVDGEALLEDVDVMKFMEPGTAADKIFQRLGLEIHTPAGIEKLRSVWNRVMGPRHLRSVLPALVQELESRRRSGMPWSRLVEDLRLDVHLKGAYVTLVDLNGYTDCLLEGEFHEKVKTAGGVIHAFERIADEVGAVLLEPVIGDAGVFLTFNQAQQDALEARLAQLKIPMHVQSLASRTNEDGSAKYPLDDKGQACFTDSKGIFPLQGEGVDITVHASLGNSRGGLIVRGNAYKQATELQKEAKAGQTLREPGQGMDHDVPAWNTAVPMPANPWIALKAIEAVLQITAYSEAAVDELFQPRDTKETLRTSRLNSYYLVLGLEPLEEDEAAVDRFWTLLRRQGTGTNDITLFKPVGESELHFWTSESIKDPASFKAAFQAFLKQINGLAKEAGVRFALSMGHEPALELIALPNSFQVDATGPSIVATVRGKAGLKTRKTGNWVSVDSSACEALDMHNEERVTTIIKNRPYSAVHAQIDEEGHYTVSENLVGREAEKATVRKFIQDLGVNGVSLKIRQPLDAEDRGYGESAMIRWAERTAVAELGVSKDRLIHLGNNGRFFSALEKKLGYTVAQLIENPELVQEPVLLFLDTDSIAPEDSAELNRLLFAMVGRPFGLIHTGAYQFRPESMMGNQYNGRPLEVELEVGPLSPEEALSIIFQVRPDLEMERDGDGVLALLQTYKRQLAPRFIIRNFARALRKRNDMIDLDEETLHQIWPGELALLLEQAGVGEEGRGVMGVAAEMGIPVDASHIEAILGFDCRKYLTQLVEAGLLQVEEEGERKLFTVARPQYRRLRLLARKHRPEIHRFLVENQFLREAPAVSRETAARCLVELEHALSNSEICIHPRTFELVYELGRYHSTVGKNFGAAYIIYHDFYAALERHGHLNGSLSLPPHLALDLMWAFTQTAHRRDVERSEKVFRSGRCDWTVLHKVEALWRREGRMAALLPLNELPELSANHAFEKLVNLVRANRTYFETRRTRDHEHLEYSLRLADMFDGSAEVAETLLVPGGEMVPLAFKAASLARRANAARICGRFIEQLGYNPMSTEEVDLLEELRTVHSTLHLEILMDLGHVEAQITVAPKESEFSRELLAEVYRFLADARKYLFPIPSDKEFSATDASFKRAHAALKSLERPLPFAGFDCHDVNLNVVALYWERKIKDTREPLDRNQTWVTLSGYEALVREQIAQTVRLGMTPFKHRLMIQLMNLLEVKLRLLIRERRTGDEALIAAIDSEYKQLSEQTGALHQVLMGKAQPDYYSLVISPLLAMF